MTEKPKNKYTLKELRSIVFGFVKYLIRFFFASSRREKSQEKRKKEVFKKVHKELKDGYKKIDAEKEAERNKSEKERLDNLF